MNELPRPGGEPKKRVDGIRPLTHEEKLQFRQADIHALVTKVQDTIPIVEESAGFIAQYYSDHLGVPVPTSVIKVDTMPVSKLLGEEPTEKTLLIIDEGIVGNRHNTDLDLSNHEPPPDVLVRHISATEKRITPISLFNDREVDRDSFSVKGAGTVLVDGGINATRHERFQEVHLESAGDIVLLPGATLLGESLTEDGDGNRFSIELAAKGEVIMEPGAKVTAQDITCDIFTQRGGILSAPTNGMAIVQARRIVQGAEGTVSERVLLLPSSENPRNGR